MSTRITKSESHIHAFDFFGCMFVAGGFALATSLGAPLALLIPSVLFAGRALTFVRF